MIQIKKTQKIPVVLQVFFVLAQIKKTGVPHGTPVYMFHMKHMLDLKNYII